MKKIFALVALLGTNFLFASHNDLHSKNTNSYLNNINLRVTAGIGSNSKAVDKSFCQNTVNSGDTGYVTYCDEDTFASEKKSDLKNRGLSFAGSFSLGLYDWRISNRFKTEVAFWAFSDFTQNLNSTNDINRNAVLGRFGLELAMANNDRDILVSLGLHDAVISLYNTKYHNNNTAVNATTPISTPSVVSTKEWKNHLGVNGSVYLTPFKCKDNACSFGVGVTGGCSRGKTGTLQDNSGRVANGEPIDLHSTTNKYSMTSCEGMLGFAVTTS